MKRCEYGPVESEEPGPVPQVSGKADLDFSRAAAGAPSICLWRCASFELSGSALVGVILMVVRAKTVGRYQL